MGIRSDEGSRGQAGDGNPKGRGMLVRSTGKVMGMEHGMGMWVRDQGKGGRA